VDEDEVFVLAACGSTVASVSRMRSRISAIWRR